MIDYDRMMAHVMSHPFPLVFATISGAHLYGFILNESAKLNYLDELIQRKQTGAEKGVRDAVDMEFYRGEYERLTKGLERAYEESTLPEMPSGRAVLSEFLVRLRLNDA